LKKAKIRDGATTAVTVFVDTRRHFRSCPSSATNRPHLGDQQSRTRRPDALLIHARADKKQKSRKRPAGFWIIAPAALSPLFPL
jgi:hypothetical protein